MGIMKDRFRAKSDAAGAEIRDLLKEHGTKKIGEVQLSQVYQGMRGITGLVSETSLLDAHEGIRFRDTPFPSSRQNCQKPREVVNLCPKDYFI